ncbi:hypothetical protein L3Q82_024096 [Scortum barcoo]|uniref:Uncharacterized protein n=1 Tax=Scortum barcoo TaxID=214431 RepID=A0ACB8WXU2_9TELE|nr:hypothetical protein L3Q82_024096 [Scortum barcoo]
MSESDFEIASVDRRSMDALSIAINDDSPRRDELVLKVYPLYQLGNPQLRLFRPNWFLTLVKPGKEQPPDTVQFRIPMDCNDDLQKAHMGSGAGRMTKCDVKNYLEKIYDVPVGAVRTRIQFVEGGAAAVPPGGDAASQDTLYGSPVEAAEV